MGNKRKSAAGGRTSPPLCSACRWWDTTPYGRASGIGLCRRNPPSVKTLWDDDIEERDSWPETTEAEWCGECTPNKQHEAEAAPGRR